MHLVLAAGTMPKHKPGEGAVCAPQGEASGVSMHELKALCSKLCVRGGKTSQSGCGSATLASRLIMACGRQLYRGCHGEAPHVDLHFLSWGYCHRYFVWSTCMCPG